MRKLLMTAAVMFGAAGVGVVWMQPTVQAAGTAEVATAAPASAPLGDLTSMEAIVADTTAIAATGDMAKAQARITDFETAWDDAAATMRPLDPLAWGNVDAAADAALDALRAPTPDAASVTATLAALSASLAEPIPGGTTATAPVAAALVVGPDGTFATTDANGHDVPCEDFVAAVQRAQAASTLAPADQATADDLQAKGTERCNADDDARADAFLAEALTLLAP